MVLSKEAEHFLREGTLKENTPPQAPPKEKEVIFKTPQIAQNVEEAKAQLEILRIQKDIERLSKPDIPETNYFKEMMEQQKQHFNQLLEMNKSQNELKLEIEKMKIFNEAGGDTDNTMEYLEMLKPLIPLIAQGIKKKDEPKKEEIKKEEKKEVKKPMMNAEEMEEYKKKIKSGEITEEMAYKDFIAEVGEKLAITYKAKFEEEFNKIKNAV